MAQVYTPAIRALVVAALLVATAALLHVTVQTARAAGALAIGSWGAYGEAHDFHNPEDARRSALAKCKGDICCVVAGCPLSGQLRQCLRWSRLGQSSAARRGSE